MRKILALLVFSVLLLAACSETAVVKLDEKKTTEPATAAEVETQVALTNTSGGVSASTTGKTAVKCDDTDLNDPSIIGLVTVKYDDETEEKFYDQCIADSDILAEYFCEGVNAKSKNTICHGACLQIKVDSDPTEKVGFCS